MNRFGGRRGDGIVVSVVLFALVASFLLGVSLPGPVPPPAVASPQSVAAPFRATGEGSLVTQVSLGPGTQLEVVDMLSATRGYALAHDGVSGATRTYLVATSDAARSWHVVGPCPGVGEWSFFATSGVPALDFVTPRVGYVKTGTSLDVTRDAGRTWHEVPLAGTLLDWVAGPRGLVVASSECSPCQIIVQRLPLGAATLSDLQTMPLARTLNAVLSMTVDGTSVDVLTASTSVLASPQLWRVSGTRVVEVPTPGLSAGLRGVSAAQLLAADGGLYLNEFTDTGMSQGYDALWFLTPTGQWSRRQYVSPMGGNAPNNFGDTMHEIGVLGGGGDLIALTEGASSALYVSRDGGFTWSTTPPPKALVASEGASGSIAPWGAGAMILTSYTGNLLSTLNGRSLRSLTLPTGVASPVAWCAPPVFSLRMQTSGPGGDTIVTAQNGLTEPCRIEGPAYLEFETGPTHRVRNTPAAAILRGWPSGGRTLQPGEEMVFTVHLTFGGSSCAPTFIPRVVLAVGPERYLVYESPTSALGVCVSHRVGLVKAPRLFRPI